MSFLGDFESRIGSVFNAASSGYDQPFSFKKLAKRAAREMEAETLEIDGVDTAPGLYTILVAPQDDSRMRPLYDQITFEVAAFVSTRAQRKGYSFVGNPLVRFMVDPSLKPGHFAVFAENVDALTLERLRDEERAFLEGNSSVGGAAAQMQRRSASSAARDASRRPTPRTSLPAFDDENNDELDPLAPISPAAFGGAAQVAPVAAGVAAAGTGNHFAAATPDFGDQGFAPVNNVPAPTPSAFDAEQPLPNVPLTQRRNVPLVDPRRAAAAQPVPSDDTATCLLVDRQSGRTYTGVAPVTTIGRERSAAQIVLRDPNVSRRHAQIAFDGRNWLLTDLGSTNGTLVNDVEVRECILRDGDLVTMGLINLEFRENPR